MTAQILDRRLRGHDTHGSTAAVNPSSESHEMRETQCVVALGTPSTPGHPSSESQTTHAGGTSSESQRHLDAHGRNALGTPVPDAIVASKPKSEARQGSTSIGQEVVDTHVARADGTLSPAASDDSRTMTVARRGTLQSGYLMLLSDSLDDIEGVRIATENRVRALTRDEADSDGEVRGLGLDVRSPEVATAMAMLGSLNALEHQATLAIQREVRKHPLYGWVKREKGIGEKQAARLLAVIGDPYWNALHDRPRTVSELWAYCGYSVINGQAQRRRKGVQANWNDKAKSRAFLMAQSCVKAVGGRYRGIYDAAREQYADAVHAHDCVRCGPAGRPALAGSPLSAGHQHQRALRRVSKEILRDLWVEARDAVTS